MLCHSFHYPKLNRMDKACLHERDLLGNGCLIQKQKMREWLDNKQFLLSKLSLLSSFHEKAWHLWKIIYDRVAIFEKVIDV
jgi:hypothetical protein